MYSTPQPTRRPPLPPRHRHARGLAWLAGAISALAVLAAAAAAVSWDAQYVLVARARHAPVIAALEAGIPDAGAAVFAALGIALALHGHRALRPRGPQVRQAGPADRPGRPAARPVRPAGRPGRRDRHRDQRRGPPAPRHRPPRPARPRPGPAEPPRRVSFLTRCPPAPATAACCLTKTARGRPGPRSAHAGEVSGENQGDLPALRADGRAGSHGFRSTVADWLGPTCVYRCAMNARQAEVVR